MYVTRHFLSSLHSFLSISPGSVASNDLNEASGLAASRFNPGVLYSHNDHGEDNPPVYAFYEDGSEAGE